MKTYCINCGALHQELDFPKKCLACGREMYVNPIPVVVVVVKTPQGVVLVQRGIEPHIGGWALPGGFVDQGETYQEAAKRELQEELNFKYLGDFKLIGIESTPNRANMLIMLETDVVDLAEINFIKNSEVLNYRVTAKPEPLCFPLHSIYLAKVL